MSEEKYWFPVYGKNGNYAGYLALLIEDDDIGWGDSIPTAYAHFVGEKPEGNASAKSWGKVYTEEDIKAFYREMPVRDLEMLETLKEIWKN